MENNNNNMFVDRVKGMMVLRAKAHFFLPMFILMIAGFSMLIVGFVFIWTNTGENLKVNEIIYNSAVQDWNAQYRDDFSVGFTLSSPDFMISGSMAADLTPDIISADNGIKLEEYTPLKYTMPIGTAIPPVAYSTGRKAKIAVFPNAQGSLPVISQELLLMPTQIYNSTNLNCSFATCAIVCRERSGTWDPVLQQCAVFMALNGFCNKLIGMGSSWAPSNIYGGGDGCNIQNNWTVTNYTIVATIPKPYYVFSGNISLRSVYDPYIVAAQLTNGTFHITRLEEPELLQLGEILSIAGIVLLISMLVAIFATFQYFHRKYFGSEYQPVRSSRFH